MTAAAVTAERWPLVGRSGELRLLEGLLARADARGLVLAGPPGVGKTSVVPVVVISACGLLCLAFYNRLSAMVTRLRGFHRERLEHQGLLDRHGAAAASGPAAAQAAARHARLLDVLEQQTSHVARRARLIRSTLLCLL